MRRSLIIIFVSLKLSFVCAWIAFHLHSSSLSSISRVHYDISALLDSHHELSYLDEVVTMSLLQAATQPHKPEWLSRYYTHSRLLEHQVTQLSEFSDLDIDPNWILQTQTIYLNRTQVEAQAASWIENKSSSRAIKALTSSKYLDTKEQFHNNLDKYAQKIFLLRDSNAKQAKSQMRLATLAIVFLALSLISSLLYMGRNFLKLELELDGLNHDLEKRVEERSKELEHERMMTLKTAKLITVGEMAATIAHDVANPLTVILARGQRAQKLLFQEPIDRKEIERNLSSLLGMAGRIQKLVQNIHSFARTEKNELWQTFHPKEVLADCIELLEEKARKKGVTLLHEHQGEEEVLAPRTQIMQILVNLASNAIDAASPTRQGEVKMVSKTTAQGICFEVWDSGSGIPEDIRTQIFEPLFSTKPKGAGTGLGLSIVKRLVDHLNGEVSYERRLGWTVFAVQLPLEKAGAHTPQAA